MSRTPRWCFQVYLVTDSNSFSFFTFLSFSYFLFCVFFLIFSSSLCSLNFISFSWPFPSFFRHWFELSFYPVLSLPLSFSSFPFLFPSLFLYFLILPFLSIFKMFLQFLSFFPHPFISFPLWSFPFLFIAVLSFLSFLSSFLQCKGKDVYCPFLWIWPFWGNRTTSPAPAVSPWIVLLSSITQVVSFSPSPSRSRSLLIHDSCHWFFTTRSVKPINISSRRMKSINNAPPRVVKNESPLVLLLKSQ